MATGVFFFVVGNLIAWFQFNSQFVWAWWADKPLLPNLIFAIPMGICFWYAVRYIVQDTGEMWPSKLIGFGISNVIYGLLTYYFLKEGIMEAKTLVSMLLSIMIIMIQIFWK